jgi:branched-chain amino acid transport system substrate-binding protein
MMNDGHDPPYRAGRRALLAGAAVGALVASIPRAVRAQPRIVRIGAIHPASGLLAEIGLACRLAVQMAADAINATGGIAALGGARLELLVGDGASVVGPHAEAERLLAAGARVLTGAFHSGHTAAVAAVAQRRRVPFLVDTAIADAVTRAAAAARAENELPYVFRNFPTTTAFARRAVEYVVDIFAEARRPATRAVVLHTTDPLGTTQARRFETAHAALRPPFDLVDIVPLPPGATGVAAEMARVRAAAPDVLILAVRPAVVAPLFRQLARDPLAATATVSLGAPELAGVARAAGVGDAVERVMELAASPNFREPRTQRLAEEFVKRSGGRRLDAAAGYAHEAILVVANALERARAAAPGALAEALRRTTFDRPLMVATGPVVFDATGDNPNAAPALLQILGGRPVVVWPKAAAEQPYVLGAPRP